MNNQLEKLKKRNKVLSRKLKKYKHPHFGLIFLFSNVIVYFLCQALNLDNILYSQLIVGIDNSITCTSIGAVILGSILGTCKLEYMKSVRKIDKEMKKNSSKISKLAEQEINFKEKRKKPPENKQQPIIQQEQVHDELEKIKLEIIKRSVLEIMQEQATSQEIEEDTDFITLIDLDKIREEVKQKRLEK